MLTTIPGVDDATVNNQRIVLDLIEFVFLVKGFLLVRLWVKVTQSCLTLCNPLDYTVHGILQARILEWVAFPISRGSSQSIKLRSPTLQVDSLPAEPQGKPKNTGVGSLSFFQWIFPTQESNRGLLHCKQILYQLSYQGSPGWSGQVAILIITLIILIYWHQYWYYNIDL